MTVVKRPESVRLMGRTYDIKYVPGSALADGHDFGQIIYPLHTVFILDGQTPVEEADTVLHELIHAIDLTMGLDMSEHQVHHMATGLMALFQDNPEIAKYFAEDKFKTKAKKQIK